MKTLIKQVVTAFVIITALQSMFALPAIAQDRSEEYRIKGLLLNRLVGFVTWPERDEAASVHVCVIGGNPFGGQLDDIFDAESVTVGFHEDYDPQAQNCHIVFISDSEIRGFQTLLEQVQGEPVLTISDIPRFATEGGMINMTFENRRVGFLINKEEADAVGIGLSFQLLSLAEIVTSR